MEEDKRLYGDEESTTDSSETAGFLGQVEIKRQKHQRTLGRLRALRLVAEVVLASVLVILFASGTIHFRSTKLDYPHYGPILPRKDVILGNAAGFGPDIVYNNEEMLWNKTEMSHVHRNWQVLFPMGRGYVKVSDSEDFTVAHPAFKMDDVLVPGDHYEGHIMAVYHQLHCLSILTTSLGVTREAWHDMDPKIRDHRSHCVEYLRQSILCQGDTTLEGETGSWTKSTGWGQTHSCVDYDALTGWANERAIWDLTDQLLPEHYDFTKADTEGKPRSEVDESQGQGQIPRPEKVGNA